MKLAAVVRSPVPDQWLRRFFWAHPEWWIIALAGMAWGIILLRAIPLASAHFGHSHQDLSFAAELLGWGLMVVAMMLPLMLEPLRWVAFRSFRHRRHRAVFFALIGFLLPWMLAGVAAAWLRTLAWSHNPLLAAGMFGLAALWVLVPVRTRALVYCHMTAPLAPLGWKADRDCLRYSFLIGVSCVVTCCFLMLGCILSGHSLVAMLGGAVLGILERRSFRPPTGLISIGAALLAIWFLLPFS